MKRTKKDPTAWRSTPEFDSKYSVAKAEAQAKADASGRDHGLEINDLFKSFMVRALPNRENRYGHELRCEVVSCSDLSKIPAGHGPCR